MFRCHVSDEVSLPREKPVRVVLATRISPRSGLIEIAREANVRLSVLEPESATRLAVAQKPLDVGFYKKAAETRYGHAAKCKRALDDCPHCQDNVKWFAGLPLAALSHVTQEVRFR